MSNLIDQLTKYERDLVREAQKIPAVTATDPKPYIAQVCDWEGYERSSGRGENIESALASQSHRYPTWTRDQLVTIYAFRNLNGPMNAELGFTRQLVLDDPSELARGIVLGARVEWLNRRVEEQMGCGMYLDDALVAMLALPVVDMLLIERVLDAPLDEGDPSRQLLYQGMMATLRKDWTGLKKTLERFNKRKVHPAYQGMRTCLTGISQNDPALVARGLTENLDYENHLRKRKESHGMSMEAHEFWALANWVSPDLVSDFDVSQGLPWNSPLHAHIQEPPKSARRPGSPRHLTPAPRRRHRSETPALVASDGRTRVADGPLPTDAHRSGSRCGEGPPASSGHAPREEMAARRHRYVSGRHRRERAASRRRWNGSRTTWDGSLSGVRADEVAMDDLIRRLQDRLRYMPAVEMDKRYGRCNEAGEQLPPDPPRPPAALEELEKVEHTLGFTLPILVRRLYTEVADGDYGPAWGVIPLRSPEGVALRDLEDWEMSVEAWARTIREDPAPDDYPIPPHPSIYFCDAGCGIVFCLDCSTESARVFIDDPNKYGEDYTFETAAESLEQWLNAWLDQPWPTERY